MLTLSRGTLPGCDCSVLLHRWDLVKLHLPAALSWLKSHLYTLAEPAPGSAVSTHPCCSMEDAD